MRIRIVTEGASSRAMKKASPFTPGGLCHHRKRLRPYRIPTTSRAASRSTFCW
jgi:hypothetical protein